MVANNTHDFIFTPGSWLGEGQVSFSASAEQIKFYTKWHVDPFKDGGIHCRQTVEMQGVTEPVENDFYINAIKENTFSIILKNETLQKIPGKGIFDPKKIAWEFRGFETFEGFEVYQLKESGDYSFHAEYSSPDLFRTTIDGCIWKKNESNAR